MAKIKNKSDNIVSRIAKLSGQYKPYKVGDLNKHYSQIAECVARLPDKYKSRLFERENLEKLSEKQLINIHDMLSKYVSHKDQSSEIGKLGALDKKRSNWEKDESAFAKSFKEIEGVYLFDLDGKENLNNQNIRADKEIVDAFKFIGVDLKKDEHGYWNFDKNNDKYGFKFIDENGVQQTFRLEKSEIDAFCSGYLNKKNDREVKITPKGVFQYYIERLKETSSSVDQTKLKSIQEKFSIDSVEWNSLRLIESVRSNAMETALFDLRESKQEELEEKGHLSFAQDFEDRNTKTVMKRIQKDANEILLDVVTHENEPEDIEESYITTIETLETKQTALRAINRDTTEVDSNLVEIREAQEDFVILTNLIEHAAKKLKTQERYKNSSDKEIVETVLDNIILEGNKIKSFKEFGGVNAGLTSSEWQQILLEAKSEDRENTDLEEELVEMIDVDYKDITTWTEGVSLDGENLHMMFGKDALLYQSEYLAKEPNYLFKLYEKFVKDNPNSEYSAFVEHCLSMNAEEHTDGKEPGLEECILYDREILESLEGNLTGKPSQNAEKTANGIIENSKKACLYLDILAEHIYSDPETAQEFESLDDVGKKNYINNLSTKPEVQKAYTSASDERKQQAYDRWMPFIRCGTISQARELFEEACADPNMDPTDRAHGDGVINSLNNLMRETIKDKDAKDEILKAHGQPTVSQSQKELEKEDSGYEEKLVKYGSLHPSEESAYDFNKKLLPYNVKAGKKFISKMLKALEKANVIVKTPKMDGGINAHQETTETPAQETDENFNAQAQAQSQGEQVQSVEASSGIFKGLTDQEIKQKTAMYVANLAIQTALGHQEKDASGNPKSIPDEYKKIMDAMSTMSMLDTGIYDEEIKSIDDKHKTLPGVLQDFFYAQACGKNPDLKVLEGKVSPELIEGLQNAFDLLDPSLLLMSLGISSTSEISNNITYFNFGDKINESMIEKLKNCNSQEDVFNLIKSMPELSSAIKAVAYTINSTKVAEASKFLSGDALKNVLDRADARGYDIEDFNM